MDQSRVLFEAASRGDAASLNTLIERHLPALFAYVRLNIGPKLRRREASGDLVQSICREVLADAGAFRYEGEGAFRVWLYTQALHKIRHRAEFWGAQKRDPGKEVPPPDRSGHDGGLFDAYQSFCTPSRAVMRRETIERIESAFAELPDDYREVILLSRVVGLTRTEIASRMGRTEAAIRNLLPRALAALSDRIEEPPDASV